MAPITSSTFSPIRFVSSGGDAQTNMQAMAPITSIIEIFKVKNWKEVETKPKKSAIKLKESNPLSVYYHADEKLRTTVLALSQAKDQSLSKFLAQIKKIHKAQKYLLATIYLIYSGMDDQLKVHKGYRHYLPSGDQHELNAGFSEGIFFAAQALTNGFRIRGIEHCTQDLVGPATGLCAAMDALRFVFRTRALKATLPPYDDLDEVLHDFDQAWALFEEAICSAYFQIRPTRPSRSHELDMFTVLLSDTLMRGIDHNLIDPDQLKELDPQVMVALPRLALLSGLLYFPDHINLTDEDSCFWWVKPNATSLAKAQKTLNQLSPPQLVRLERSLVGLDNIEPLTSELELQIDDDSDDTETVTEAPSLDTIKINGSDENMDKKEKEPEKEALSECEVKRLFTTIAAIADGLQSGPRAKPFLQLMQKVFIMHSYEPSLISTPLPTDKEKQVYN